MSITEFFTHEATSTLVTIEYPTHTYFIDYNNEIGQYWLSVSEKVLLRSENIGDCFAEIYNRKGSLHLKSE